MRFEWTDGNGVGFCATGEYLEVTPHSRMRHVERAAMLATGMADGMKDRYARLETVLARTFG